MPAVFKEQDVLMPRYEFECMVCEQRHEVQLPMKEVLNYIDNNVCRYNNHGEPCGGQLVQVYSAPGMSFKGAGWTPRFGPE